MKQLQHDECGFSSALKAIGGKWKTTILWRIDQEPRRFGELRRLLAGVSEKVLTQQLREMEADDLVLRRVFAGKVAHVEYSVTPLGRSLNTAVTAMSTWGKAHEHHMALKSSDGNPKQIRHTAPD